MPFTTGDVSVEVHMNSRKLEYHVFCTQSEDHTRVLDMERVGDFNRIRTTNKKVVFSKDSNESPTGEDIRTFLGHIFNMDHLKETAEVSNASAGGTRFTFHMRKHKVIQYVNESEHEYVMIETSEYEARVFNAFIDLAWRHILDPEDDVTVSDEIKVLLESFWEQHKRKVPYVLSSCMSVGIRESVHIPPFITEISDLIAIVENVHSFRSVIIGGVREWTPETIEIIRRSLPGLPLHIKIWVLNLLFRHSDKFRKPTVSGVVLSHGDTLRVDNIDDLIFEIMANDPELVSMAFFNESPPAPSPDNATRVSGQSPEQLELQTILRALSPSDLVRADL